MRVVFAFSAMILVAGTEGGLLRATTIEPTVTTSCTVDGVATPCANVSVQFQAQVEGTPQIGPGVFMTQWSAATSAGVVAPTVQITASIRQTLSATAYTAGPVRPGFAMF
jgi:hypothetical protein